MESIINEEFMKYMESYKQKSKKVLQSFEEMDNCYKECDDFFKSIAMPHNYELTDIQARKEKQLKENYCKAIKKWQTADEDLSNLCKQLRSAINLE